MASITIPKDYFDTLMRRAELHHSSDNDSTVTITTSEYNALHHSIREYTSLRTALLAGGAAAETLDVLINTPISNAENCSPGPLKIPSVPQSKPWPEAAEFIPMPFQKCRLRTKSTGNWRADLSPVNTTTDPSPTSASPDSFGSEHDASDNTSVASPETDAIGREAEEEEDKQEHKYQDNHDHRTLVVKGLSKRTTLADIAKVIRGGPILNFTRRAHDREALVSFVEPIAAEKFLMYSKRSDIYIRGKRVEVFWADRQRYMPGHVDHKISRFGASRNLVIRFPKDGMAPGNVHDDLEHIDRLEVVEIRMLEGRHLLVSTNDVSLAVTARTCMCSRLKYKGSRIEFVPDECGEPLPPIMRRPPVSRTPQVSPKKSSVTLNRFKTLAFLGIQSDDSDD